MENWANREVYSALRNDSLNRCKNTHIHTLTQRQAKGRAERQNAIGKERAPWITNLEIEQAIYHYNGEPRP